MESGQGGRQTNCREMYIAFSIRRFRDNIGGAYTQLKKIIA